MPLKDWVWIHRQVCHRQTELYYFHLNSEFVYCKDYIFYSVLLRMYLFVFCYGPIFSAVEHTFMIRSTSHLILSGAVILLKLLTKGEQINPQEEQFPLLEWLATIFSVIQKNVLSLSEFDMISINIPMCLCIQNIFKTVKLRVITLKNNGYLRYLMYRSFKASSSRHYSSHHQSISHFHTYTSPLKDSWKWITLSHYRQALQRLQRELVFLGGICPLCPVVFINIAHSLPWPRATVPPTTLSFDICSAKWNNFQYLTKLPAVNNHGIVQAQWSFSYKIIMERVFFFHQFHRSPPAALSQNSLSLHCSSHR